MAYEQPTRGAFKIGNNRSGEWKTLKLYVTRGVDNYLTLALIVQANGGLPFLDPEIRGIQVPWYPYGRKDDLRRYALLEALLAVTETPR